MILHSDRSNRSSPGAIISPLGSECIALFLQVLLTDARRFQRRIRWIFARVELHHDDFHFVRLLEQPQDSGHIHFALSKRTILRPVWAAVPILQMDVSEWR